MTGEISATQEGFLATITIANPARVNAMSRVMWHELRTIFEGFASETAIRCIVVCGSEGNFCAGGDISEYPTFRFDRRSLEAFHEVEVWGALQAMLRCPVPMLAQIEGSCMGAGLEIASCCDLRLASASARFGAPIARLGFPMAPREARLIGAAVGDALARDMLLAASVHDAARLYDAGFLLLHTPDTDIASAVRSHAERIMQLSPMAARLNKSTLFMQNHVEPPAAQALTAINSVADEMAGAYDYAAAPEHREGIAAFLAKRPPKFF